MVADSRHREKTFIIKEKKLESTILFQSQKKKFMKSRKKVRNREKKIKIKENISELRK